MCGLINRKKLGKNSMKVYPVFGKPSQCDVTVMVNTKFKSLGRAFVIRGRELLRAPTKQNLLKVTTHTYLNTDGGTVYFPQQKIKEERK